MTRRTGMIIFIMIYCFIYFASTSFSQPHTGNKKQSFTKFFPDTALAEIVARMLNKSFTDDVTARELAGISGYLDLGATNVSHLTGIGYLTGIDSFSCYKNEVVIIPAEIGKLKRLRYLDLCKAYAVEQLSPQIGDLKALVHIRICLTQITAVPKEIGNLPKLKNLDLGANGITQLPKEIGNLKNLKVLDLSANPIEHLPDELCRLSSLTVLSVAHCKLTRIPENIGNLKSLRRLNLFENDIRYLPRSISRLSNLRYLNIYNNLRLSESYKSYLPKLLRKK